MSNENAKNNVIEQVETEEVEVTVEESKFKQTMTKIGQKVKKHKKAIITASVVAVGATLFGVLRGKKSSKCDFDNTDETIDDELVELVESEEVLEDKIEVE